MHSSSKGKGPPAPEPSWSSYPSEANTNKENCDLDASTLGRVEAPVPPSLKIKRVDHHYSDWDKSWKYRDSNSKVTAESSIPIFMRGPWEEYSFIFVRRIPKVQGEEPTFKIIIKNEYIVKACKDVIGSWPGISWNANPLEVDPEVFLTVLDKFTEYRDKLRDAVKKTIEQNHVLSSINLLLSFLYAEYQTTIRLIDQHKTHRETTFNHLYALLVPNSLLVARCGITGQPRVFELKSWTRGVVGDTLCYQLMCESVDLVDNPISDTVGISRVQANIAIKSFWGTIPIGELVIYPLKYHVEPERLKECVVRRGKKWVDLIGIHHKEFDGIAIFEKDICRTFRRAVKGRVMIDRVSFKRFNANYRFPIAAVKHISVDSSDPSASVANRMYPSRSIRSLYDDGSVAKNKVSIINDRQSVKPEISDEELLLTPTTVYGFSLSDKLWLQFDVEKISDVKWNSEAFTNLILPDGRRQLLQSLVEAHHREIGFDDFIEGI
ncbi:hypothetical protein VNI00_016150 [Paramarasmius palmivorus]|uniref:DUF7025 domain-containing protein n=1 Tax=Paramarasmius palmivorus TaxID=297713 RepID=A0AAW0BD41_9AGAR